MVVGILVVLGSTFGVLLFFEPAIDTYLWNQKEVLHLYDFYGAKVGQNETAVFFIGSSMIGDSIYTQGINEYLADMGLDITTYCLVMQGDLPIRRTVQIQNIIDAAPSLVVIGVTYENIISPSWPPERVILVHDKLKIRDDSLYLFSNSEIEDLSKEPDLWYKKQYIRSLFTYTPSSKEQWNYFVHPYHRVNLSFENSPVVDVDDSTIVNQLMGVDKLYISAVDDSLTRYKEALIYNVQTLQNAGIPVVVINMPLHPITSSYITDDSRQNMYDLLNQTGAIWYDMERDYGREFFKDNHHASNYGALLFAPRMADLIIQELS